MDSNEVAIAAIGLAATAVGGIIWVIKYLANTLSKDFQAHTKAAVAQTQASKSQEKASQEVLIFMKALNGKLTKATVDTAKESSDAS